MDTPSSMPIDDQPTPTSTETVSVGENMEGMNPTIKFSPDQAAKAGLDDCKPGDQYTVTMRLKMVGTPDEPSFEIVNSQPPSSVDEKQEAATEEEDDAIDGADKPAVAVVVKPPRKPMQRTLTPKEAGF